MGFVGFIGHPRCLPHYHGDNQRVEEAILLITDTTGAELQTLDRQYALARSKALAIRSQELRNRTLGEVEKTYAERKVVIEEVEKLKLQIAALTQGDYSDLGTLRSAREKAEELASHIRLAAEATEILASIAAAFEKQQDIVSERIAAEERRRVEEEWQRAELRRMEAEAEQLQLARAEAESERQRLASAAAQRRAQPADCCCKVKVDRGAIFTKWVYEYKRLDKRKCTNPGFWDAHAEGWCVPDSSCY